MRRLSFYLIFALVLLSNHSSAQYCILEYYAVEYYNSVLAFDCGFTDFQLKSYGEYKLGWFVSNPIGRYSRTDCRSDSYQQRYGSSFWLNYVPTEYVAKYKDGSDPFQEARLCYFSIYGDEQPSSSIVKYDDYQCLFLVRPFELESIEYTRNDYLCADEDFITLYTSFTSFEEYTIQCSLDGVSFKDILVYNANIKNPYPIECDLMNDVQPKAHIVSFYDVHSVFGEEMFAAERMYFRIIYSTDQGDFKTEVLQSPKYYRNYPIEEVNPYVSEGILYGSKWSENDEIDVYCPFTQIGNKNFYYSDLTQGARLPEGPMTITFSRGTDYCQVERSVYIPKIEYNYVDNDNQHTFWYETERRDALNLDFMFPDNNETASIPYNIGFENYSQASVNYSASSAQSSYAKLSKYLGYTESTLCWTVRYPINTKKDLETISLTSQNTSFIPVTIKLDKKQLNAYPKITATLNDGDITPPVCNEDDVVVKFTDVKDGLGGDYTFAVAGNDYDFGETKKVSNGIWSISLNKKQIESVASLETISLSIFDANVPSDDKWGRDARSKSFTFTVKRPQKLEIKEFSFTNLRCNQDNSGSIEITKVNRSYENEPVSYHWYIYPNTEIDQEIKKVDSNPTIEGLSENDYVVKITNNKCEYTSNIIRIDEPPQLIIGNPTVTDAMCYGYHDGAITTETTGGTPYKDEADKPYYHYHWKQDKNSTSQPWDNDRTTADISDLPAGKYQLTVWDANYCEATTDWITVSHPIELINSLTSSYTICKGSELAIDDGNQNPGNFNCYEWRLPNNTTRQGREITIKPDMPQGKYVLVSKNDNCFTTNTTEIIFVDNNLPIRFLVPTESFLGDTLVIAEDSEIDDDYTWRYAFNTEMFSDITDKVVNPNANLTFLHIDRSGNDIITMYADNGFCKASLSKEVTVSPHFREEDYDYTVDAAGIFSRLQIGPNPNNGEFTLFANLTEDSPLTISLYDVMRSRKIPIDFSKYKTPASHYQIPFQGLGLRSGAYTLLVSANGETKQIKFVVE